MTARASRCPECGAPLRVSAASCAYCRVELAYDAPAEPSARSRPLDEALRPAPRRLARALDEGGGRALFEAGKAAWSKRAAAGAEALSQAERRDANRLGATLALSYAAALEAPELDAKTYDARVAALWGLVSELPRAEVDAAVDRWDAMLEEGAASFLGKLAKALHGDADRRAAFELAAAAAAPHTEEDEEVFAPLAEALGVGDPEAVAARVSRPLA